MKTCSLMSLLMWLPMAALLTSCGGGGGDRNREAASTATASQGQVGSTPAVKHSFYAASRFAEQASFGPTPTLVAELQATGFEAWIDQQLALPTSPLDPTPVEPDKLPLPFEYGFVPAHIMARAVGAPDQLRQRVRWSIGHWIVGTSRQTSGIATAHWVNLLERHAFGNYGQLLKEVTINPTMGDFLNNSQNRPKSTQCPECYPNENYARELMQLFTIGVIKLAQDGTPIRDGTGRSIEAYSQRDVEQLARVFTGWTFDPVPADRPPRNFANWAKPMVASPYEADRDAGQKLVLGRVFPAGQSAAKDLDDAIDLLMKHPNTAPFVSIRMIQHLVKSDPSPAYVGRVAARFRDNGSGTPGDLKAVVKAVLLDPEARQGDDPNAPPAASSKLREPVLHMAAALRGLGCRRDAIYADGSSSSMPNTQLPFKPDSVFGFYAPTDRLPSGALPAPESKLLTASEFTNRTGQLAWMGLSHPLADGGAPMRAAGCEIDLFTRTLAQSPDQFLTLLGQRFFRGGMPASVRIRLQRLINGSFYASGPDARMFVILQMALATPAYGVVK